MAAQWRPVRPGKMEDLCSALNRNGGDIASNLAQLAWRQEDARFSVNIGGYPSLDVGSQASLYVLPAGSRSVGGLKNGVAGQEAVVFCPSGVVTLVSGVPLINCGAATRTGPAIIRFLCLDGTVWVAQ